MFRKLPLFFLSCLGTNTYCIKNSRQLSTRLHVDRSEHKKKKLDVGGAHNFTWYMTLDFHSSGDRPCAIAANATTAIILVTGDTFLILNSSSVPISLKVVCITSVTCASRFCNPTRHVNKSPDVMIVSILSSTTTSRGNELLECRGDITAELTAIRRDSILDAPWGRR